MARLSRIKKELALAVIQYSQSRQGDFDKIEGRWVCIYNFPLPRGYNYRRTDLLVVLPPGYPETPPDWFYLDPGLRFANGNPPHYFELPSTHPDKAPAVEGWAGGCLHIDHATWKSKADVAMGHSLLTVFKLIEQAFIRWANAQH